MEIVGYIIGFYVLSLINGQFYQLSQTLISHHIAYWLLPIVVYPLLFIPFFFVPSVNALFEWAALFAQLVMRGNIAFYLPALLLLTLLFALNRRVILRHIYYEAYTITAQKKTKRRVLSLNFLEHFEELSEYLKLEVHFIQRNKQHLLYNLLFVLDILQLGCKFRNVRFHPSLLFLYLRHSLSYPLNVL